MLFVFFAAFCVVVSSLLYRYRAVVGLLLSSDQDTTLSFAANQVDKPTVTLVIAAFIGRSLVTSLRRSIPRKNHGPIKPGPVSLTMPLHINDEDIRLYQLATGVDKTDWDNAAQLALFLSAISEPAMLLLLGNPACPIQPLGSVNTGNRFEILRPDLCRPEQLKSAGDLKIIASLEPKSTLVKRGFVYSLEVRIVRDNKDVIFRQTFNMLQFARHNCDVPAATNGSAEEDLGSGDPQNRYTMNVTYNAPSQWAALCKDYNPIHISNLAAKLLGFPGKIAHGNHVAALAMANPPGDSLLRMMKNGRAIWFEVFFKRPTIVPANLDVSLLENPNGEVRFEVSRKSKVSVYGRLGFL